MDLSGIDVKSLRKYILIGLGGLTLLILIIWYFSNSWLIVSTKATDATITIYQGGGTVKQQKGGWLFTPLSPGNYTVEVRNNSGASSKFSAQGNGAFAIIDLDVKPNHTPDDVIAQNASDISASRDNLAYVRTNQPQGLQLVTANSYSSIQTNQTFESVQWLDPSFGVALTTPRGEGEKMESQVGIISSGKNFSPLTLPASVSNKAASVGVSANRDIFLSIESDLYRKKPSESEFRRIYSGKGPLSILSGSKNIVLFEQKNITNSDELVNGSIILLDADGKQKGSQDDSYAIDPTNTPSAAQSPDGKNIAVLIAGRITLYNDRLEKTQSLPQPGAVASLSWQDDKTLVFSAKNTLWLYSLQDETTRSLAFDSSDRTITTLSLDNDTNTVYFSSNGKTSNDVLRRVSIKDSSSTSSDTAKKLATVLPYDVSMALCRADYLNFTQPTIVITKLQENDAATTKENLQLCNDEIKAYLERQRIDTKSIKFIQTYSNTLGAITL